MPGPELSRSVPCSVPCCCPSRQYPEPDPESAAAYVLKSIEVDDKCAECFATLAKCSNIQMDMGASQDYISKANHLAASLPERQKLGIQHLYYLIKEERKKATLLLNTWIKLYPSDYTPYSKLIS